MSIYDINGKEIASGGEVSTAQVKSALISAVASGDVNLGSAIGATLAYTSPGEAWETNAETAYQNLLTAYKEIPNSGIPFFISTDQHGRGVEQHRWFNNRDTDGMHALNINLGDTVINKFRLAELDPILARTKLVKNYISAVGNHDKSQNTSSGADVANDYDINRTFITTMKSLKNVSPMNCYSILDGAHNATILAVDTNIQDDAGERQGITTPVAEWIISELTNCETDILWLNHWPLFDSCQQRGDTEETTTGLNTITGGNAVQFAVWQMLLDRKNKTSGTYTDDEGVEHSYDFTACKSDLLCCLHGHIHTEWYTTARGLTAYAAPMCGNTRTCTFGLIDRINGKVTFWVFDSTGCLDQLELPI